jgi:flavodoxin I
MISTVLIYGSSRGNTELVAKRFKESVDFPVDLMPAQEVRDQEVFARYRVFLFFASTWGDGELQEDMESLLVRLPISLEARHYALCELGNYYGYDDFEFGALRILSEFLQRSGGMELVEPFCMDSLPKKDWAGFEKWTATVKSAVGKLR